MKDLHLDQPDEQGVTAVEYALVLGLVSLLILGATVSLGGMFTTWADHLVDVVGSLLS